MVCKYTSYVLLSEAITQHSPRAHSAGSKVNVSKAISRDMGINEPDSVPRRTIKNIRGRVPKRGRWDQIPSRRSKRSISKNPQNGVCLMWKMFPHPWRLVLSHLEIPSSHILENQNVGEMLKCWMLTFDFPIFAKF